MKNSDQAAFPRQSSQDKEKTVYNEQIGLTKREYFAIMAMQGILANATTHDFYRVNDDYLAAQIISADAIKCADELLKQLEP